MLFYFGIVFFENIDVIDPSPKNELSWASFFSFDL